LIQSSDVGGVTTPDSPQPLVSRDSVIRYLIDRFSPSRPTVLVVGEHGIGKTTLLNQFVHVVPDACVSYFIGDDMPSSQPSAFLRDTCEQMRKLLGVKPPPDYVPPDGLIPEFAALFSQLAQRARSGGSPIYFVVDGLDLANRYSQGRTILDNLPWSPKRNVYLLLASAPCAAIGKLPVQADEYPLLTFDEGATAEYLGDLVSRDEAKRVHAISNGLPAYIAEIRLQLLAGTPADSVLDNAGAGLDALFQRKWEKAEADGIAGLSDSLAVIAFSPKPLSQAEWRDVCGHEVLPEAANAQLVQTSRTTGAVVFDSELFRRFVRTKLEARRATAEELLVRYYLNHPHADKDMTVLPALYSSIGNYDAQKALVTPEYLETMLTRTHDLARVRETISMVAAQARDANDFEGVLRYVLQQALVGEIAARRQSAQDEVAALLALGTASDMDDALSLCYSAQLPEDRFELFVLAARQLPDEAAALRERVLDDAEDLAQQLSESLPMSRVLTITGSLLDLRPRAAVELIEKQAASRGREFVETALVNLSLGFVETGLLGDLHAKIEDDALRRFLQARTVASSSRNGRDAVDKASELDGVTARILSLKGWCETNRGAPDGALVVAKALEWFTQSEDTRPPVSWLTALLASLSDVSPEVARPLAERALLIFPAGSGSEDTADMVDFGLEMARLESLWSFVAGADRILNLFIGLENVQDLDVRALCLARVLDLVTKMDPEDACIGIQADVKGALRVALDTLLENSAEQFKALRRVLGAIAAFDSAWATSVAGNLNTAERRDEALAEIVTSFFGPERPPADVSVIAEVAEKIIDRDLVLGPLLVGVLERLADGEDPPMGQIAGRIYAIVQSLPDPMDRALCLASLAKWVGSKNDAIRTAAVNEAAAACGQISSQSAQLDVMLRVCQTLASVNSKIARKLLDHVRAERLKSAAVDTAFDSLYSRVLYLSVEALGNLVRAKGNPTAELERVVRLIERLPSRIVQLDLLSRAAFALFRASSTQWADALMKEEVMPRLDDLATQFDYGRAMCASAAALAWYDHDELLTRARSLPADPRDRALKLAIRSLITGLISNEDEDGADVFDPTVDKRRIQRAIKILSDMGRDHPLVDCIRVIVTAATKSKEVNYADKVDFAKELQVIVDARLPDPDNIRHPGYKVVAAFYISSLHASARQKPDWAGLAAEARSIPNIADRALVCYWGAEWVHDFDRSVSRDLLSDAARIIPRIPDRQDRVDRKLGLASAYLACNDENSATELLRQTLSEGLPSIWETQQLAGRVIDIAARRSPEIAADIASSVSSLVDPEFLRRRQDARRLQRQPSSLTIQHGRGAVDDPRTLAEGAYLLIASFSSGMGTAQRESVVIRWLDGARAADMREAEPVARWAIQNCGYLSGSPEKHRAVFEAVLQGARLVWDIGTFLTTPEGMHLREASGRAALPADLVLVGKGDRPSALARVDNWIRDTSREWLVICDPFFAPQELEVLRNVPGDVHVKVLMGKRNIPGLKGVDLDDFPEAFAKAWREFSDMDPPVVDFLVLSTKSGAFPVHDRYVLTSGGGLSLGTSFNGLGLRDSKIDVLDSSRASAVYEGQIEPYVSNETRFLSGESMTRTVFRLSR
jgi:hypothetical protein